MAGEGTNHGRSTDCCPAYRQVGAAPHIDRRCFDPGSDSFRFFTAQGAVKGPLTRVDQRIADQQNRYNLRDGYRVHLAKLVTQLGSTVVLIHGRRGGRRVSRSVPPPPPSGTVSGGNSGAKGVITNNIIKTVVGRSRPHFDQRRRSHALGKSFPVRSCDELDGRLRIVVTHCLATAAHRCSSFDRSSRYGGLIVAIAASRVALGVHYVSDVVAGIVLGYGIGVGFSRRVQGVGA